VVWQKLKNAKESDKHIEKLQKKVAELEQEREQKWEDTVKELEEATPAKQPIVKPLALGDASRLFRIVHVDDENWLLEMVKKVSRSKFTNVNIDTFQNGDEAWKELLQADPDLLITDLRNDNVPGRTQSFGKSGYELLSLLAKRKVKYPVLVLSGSLAMEGYQSRVRQLIGSDLNVSFLKKPFTFDQLYAELSKAVLKTGASESINESGNAAFFPDRMEFQIGGFLGSSHKVNYIGSGKLEYYFAENNYEWADPIILKPHRDQWNHFWRELDGIGIWKWETSYLNSRILDGTYWCLDFRFSEKSLKSEGKNAYPGSTDGTNSPTGEFLSLIKAVQKLTGVEEIR
jgi:DNA-binding response OmpR family regulator